MKISKEEVLHIANLADLEIKEEEIDAYKTNLQEIINYADIVNQAPIEGLDITIHAQEEKNRFRKDEVKEFGDAESLLQNAKSKQNNMFKVPKVIN